MDFVLPQTNAEILPFAAACATILFGLVALFAPRAALRVVGLFPSERRSGDFSGSRAQLAGFWLGVGLVAAAFYNQPFTEMALGAGWAFTAFGQLVALLSDRTVAAGWLLFVIELVLACAALAPVFGYAGS